MMDIHAFTAVSPIFNREIITDVLVAVTTQQKDISKFKKVRALWDTGATNSVITPHVINDLKMKPNGVTEVLHAGGADLVNTYLIDIALPNKIIIPAIRASECAEPKSSRFDVIIGMDIISCGDFSITGSGIKRMVSFCIPSSFYIDYTKIPNAGK